MKKIVFSDHAEDKFKILERHGFNITKETILAAVKTPDKIEKGYKNRKIAQRVISNRHIIRVVFEELNEVLRIITFYPGRRERYED